MPHSPLPWRYEKRAGGDEVIYAADDTQVHVDTPYYPSGISTYDAQFIVASVNRVAELEEALREIARLAAVADGPNYIKVASISRIAEDHLQNGYSSLMRLCHGS